eukprot:1159215-Pelagomonas_calceolata.AAC.9
MPPRCSLQRLLLPLRLLLMAKWEKSLRGRAGVPHPELPLPAGRGPSAAARVATSLCGGARRGGPTAASQKKGPAVEGKSMRTITIMHTYSNGGGGTREHVAVRPC